MTEEQKARFGELISALGDRGDRARTAANQLETVHAKFVFLHLIPLHPTCGIFWGPDCAKLECEHYCITIE